jgi:hypothetical protein
MPWKPRTTHGFPPAVRIPRHKSVVHILVKNGVACDEYVEVNVPAKTIGMRDRRKRPTRCENPA